MFQNPVKHVSLILVFGVNYVVNRQRLYQRIKLESAEFHLIYSVLEILYIGGRVKEPTFS